MTNEERLKNLVSILKDRKVNIEVFLSIDTNAVIISGGGFKNHFNTIGEAIKHLEELQNLIDDEEEENAKKRRQIRNMLKEASEEIAKRYNKQVYTISLGDYE